MRIATLILVLSGLAAPAATAGPIYTLAPGAAPAFSLAGGDFTLTDELVTPAGSSPLYLDFRVVDGTPGPGGSVTYRPDNATYQLYFLDALLPAPDPGSSHVLLEGLFSGPATLSGGEFVGDLLVTSATPDAFDTPARLDFTLDASGRVTGGTLAVGGVVPEPSSVALWLTGAGLALAGSRLARR